MKIIIISLVVTLLQGCATAYQSRGFSGGYSETQLDKNTFKVSFIGNRYTGRERVSDFALLRSSELALQYGYKYFDVIDMKSITTNSTFAAPTRSDTIDSVYGHDNTTNGDDKTFTYSGQKYNTSSPGFLYTIVCLKEKPENDIPYNAAHIYKSIAAKYGIQKQLNY